jgi:hypothetical protein
MIARYLRLFYNGAFSIASKNDLDDQNLLLATVQDVEVRMFSIFSSCTLAPTASTRDTRYRTAIMYGTGSVLLKRFKLEP